MSKVILEADHLVKIYGLGTSHPFTALKDISLKMYEGDFICVMGPSGAGKSTFINNLSTIDIPTKGNVLIDGTNMRVMSENQIARFRYQYLGFIFQEFNLLDALTIEENIAVPLALAHKDKKETHDKITKIAKRLNIEEILDHYPSGCSGGQRQRVAIARALITDPKLIVADEPTGNLDSQNSHEILELFKELNNEGISILMVTHDAMIASYSKRLLYIKDGQIEESLDRDQMSQNEYFHRIVDINSAESQKLFAN